MKKGRFTEEKMVTILREADQSPIAEVAKKHRVSDQTICAWRKRFGTLEPADVKRLQQLEQENGRLKDGVQQFAREREPRGGQVSNDSADALRENFHAPSLVVVGINTFV